MRAAGRPLPAERHVPRCLPATGRAADLSRAGRHPRVAVVGRADPPVSGGGAERTGRGLINDGRVFALARTNC